MTAASGPAMYWPKSITRRPSSAPTRDLFAARELLEALPLQDFTHVQVALRIYPDAVRAPELARFVAPLAAETPNQITVEIEHADVVFQLRDVCYAVAVDVHIRGPLEVEPHAD